MLDLEDLDGDVAADSEFGKTGGVYGKSRDGVREDERKSGSADGGLRNERREFLADNKQARRASVDPNKRPGQLYSGPT